MSDQVVDSTADDVQFDSAQVAESQDNSELARLRSEAEKLRAEAAKHRHKKKEAEQAKQDALRQNGEYKELSIRQQAELEDLRGQLDGLEVLRKKADAFDASFKSKLEALSEDQRLVVEAITDVAARQKALDMFAGEVKQAQSKAAPIATPAPAEKAGVVDFERLGATDPLAYLAAMRADPKAHQDHMAAIKRNGRPVSTIERLRAAARKG